MPAPKLRSLGKTATVLPRKLVQVFRRPTPVRTTANYLESESILGSQIFGPVPAGIDRKFFHSTQKNVWIWHENGTTIRYEVRPHGIFKRVDSQPFTKLTGAELANFRLATQSYLTTLRTHLYPTRQAPAA